MGWVGAASWQGRHCCAAPTHTMPPHLTLPLPPTCPCSLALRCPLHSCSRSGANLMGYIKCSKAAQNQIKGKFNSLFASGLQAYM